MATGSGHNGVIRVPGTDIYYIVYHRRPLSETDPNHRVVCYDRLYFNPDGTIRPVAMLVKDNFEDGGMIPWTTYGGSFAVGNGLLNAASSPAARHSWISQLRRPGVRRRRHHQLRRRRCGIGIPRDECHHGNGCVPRILRRRQHERQGRAGGSRRRLEAAGGGIGNHPGEESNITFESKRSAVRSRCLWGISARPRSRRRTVRTRAAGMASAYS